MIGAAIVTSISCPAAASVACQSSRDHFEPLTDGHGQRITYDTSHPIYVHVLAK